MSKIKTVLVTGGAGYVGSQLVPKLLSAGYQVRVLDLFLYGRQVFDAVRDNPLLTFIEGDMRHREVLEKSLRGADAVIHLACISNDPSFELNPGLGKSINYDAFIPLVEIAKDSGVRRFIYASSSSVYGIKEVDNVTENLPLEPLTDYSKFKAMCEEELEKRRTKGFTCLTVRPATVCGYSPRLRLDLTVNILTNHAINKNKITVFGGNQKRPNIHIDDMCDFYLKSLEWEDSLIDGKIYNAGYHNQTVMQIAEIVRDVVGKNVEIVTTPTDDNRSYHISSEKLKRELGFEASRTIEDAVRDLKNAFDLGKIPDSMSNTLYYNIKRMQEVKLS
ncbi:MAG: NAD-dependent epimerase/dehydratase family protein [Verrucomicrobiae bacterium]|nr:NAD-dependent epimerase/dehydratase family protein [Verrucomicrobiae bacterium]